MIKSFFKRLVPESLKKILRDRLGVPSQEGSLKRIRQLGYNPTHCLDIGAYEGNWAVEFKQVFPESAILMIEGQREKEPYLIKTKEKYSNVDYIIALLGARETSVIFNKYETASSVLAEHNETGAKTEIRQLSTLDSITSGTIFKESGFIKIDTQGYELEILKGGEKTLSTAEFVLLEVSFLDIYKNCPLAADVILFMQQRGFILYDICTLMKRPLDGMLYQADFLFIQENSQLRNDKRWS
ncbi:MAG TPA: FkbM family methyltransferase [Mucilaginibacter sp.]|nr:FkbM family methyltransferase [Mucilaginibacter sp.]